MNSHQHILKLSNIIPEKLHAKRILDILVWAADILRSPDVSKTSAINILMLLVVNFDALAQVSSFRIERRQIIFLRWMKDSNLGLWKRISSRLNAHWQTGWAIEDEANNIELDSPSLWSSSIQPTWLYVFVRLTGEFRHLYWNNPLDWSKVRIYQTLWKEVNISIVNQQGDSYGCFLHSDYSVI